MLPMQHDGSCIKGHQQRLNFFFFVKLAKRKKTAVFFNRAYRYPFAIVRCFLFLFVKECWHVYCNSSRVLEVSTKCTCLTVSWEIRGAAGRISLCITQ